MHPADRLALKFTLNDSYTVTTRSKYSNPFAVLSTVEVDGNIMRHGSTYYEIGEDISYVYRKNSDGVWHRSKYHPGSNASMISIAEELINSENYTRGFFPWSPMEYNKSFAKLDNVTVQVLANICIISGTTEHFNGLYTETIQVSYIFKFGFVFLTLPENYVID